MTAIAPVRRALISVYDKTGVVALARTLVEADVEIVSTGSTAATIAAEGLPVTAVEQVTGFPECLDGRVKTLHPHIHAGILADRRRDDHRQQLEKAGIAAFDLVVVNLYPFADTVRSGAQADEIVEQIDIGGPSMVRGAAKNHASVAVVVDPSDYSDVEEVVKAGGFTGDQRRSLATKAFRHTAAYDIHVATWMGSTEDEQEPSSSLPEWIGHAAIRQRSLRYGENPHQAAALYTDEARQGGIARATQHHGKEMSYNNYVDADAAWRAAHDYDTPAVAIIKHANPCGIAVSTDSVADAYRKAHACDPVSAFGGVIAVNAEVTEEAAAAMAEVFTEVVVAPSFASEALEILQQKKNIRVLTMESDETLTATRSLSGGFMVQQVDHIDAPGDASAEWTHVAGPETDSVTRADLEFAWRACRSVKSNAIVLAHDGASVGIGMGQVSRVDSCRLAVQRATAERARGAVAASDAFFPFPDGFEVLAEAGVRAVVQPGGSVRDADVIAAAEAAGVSMYFTGTRHFFH